MSYDDALLLSIEIFISIRIPKLCFSLIYFIFAPALLQKRLFSFILHPELNVAQDRVFITGQDIYEPQHVLYRRSFF